MEDWRRYPIGQQNFKVLRETNSFYVDKTMYVDRIARNSSQYWFLARPRRFGKSLFLSTLEYFFKGERDLFKGLYIDYVKWDWNEYPVLRLDLNVERYQEQDMLDGILNNYFLQWEEKYGVERIDASLSVRFQNIIKAAHEKTGRKVVILVDEYDKPLVGNLNNDEMFEHYRAKLASIYSNFKSSGEHIRIVFLTGVSRFSKLSVFSDLNNLNDITFDNEFAEVCGITEDELQHYFKEGIEALAEEEELTYEATLGKLKENYDGYRFGRRGKDMYNPWSVLNCLQSRMISGFWGRTGKPTLIAAMLHQCDMELEDILHAQCDEATLIGFDLRSSSPLALLYQTGYLTIKSYDRETQMYTLGIPNKEVTESLFNELVPYYVKVKSGGGTETVVRNIIISLFNGRPEKFVEYLDIFLAGIPYEMKMKDENNLHTAIYILLTLIGVKTQTEVHTSDGRIDLVVKTSRYVYIIELKLDGSAEEAMAQIEEKGYARPYEGDKRKIFKIGINFSTKTRHLDPPEIR